MPKPGQLKREDLKDMSVAEINQARKDGKLADLLTNGDGTTYENARPVGKPVNNRDFLDGKGVPR